MNMLFPKPAKFKVTPETLRQLFSYDKQTGRFYFKERPARWFVDTATKTAEENKAAWNKRYSGTETFCTQSSNGYLVANVFDKTVYAHRAAWAISHGKWPEHCIDHINGDRTDNRLANLRDVPNLKNSRNTERSIKAASGYNGVTFNAKSGLWVAQIGLKHKTVYLGHYSDPRDAALVRLGAQKALGFSSRHGGLEDDL